MNKQIVLKQIKNTRKVLQKYRLTSLFIFLIIVTMDLFYFKDTSDKGILVIILLWLFLVTIFAWKSNITLVVVIAYIIAFAFVHAFYPVDPVAERISTLIFIFLLCAITQQFIDIRKGRL
jgi:hypothetical protein